MTCTAVTAMRPFPVRPGIAVERSGSRGCRHQSPMGGGEADVVTTMLALEALGEGCTDAGLVFSINAHLWTSVVPLVALR